MKLIASIIVLLFLISCQSTNTTHIDKNKIVGRWQLVGAQGSVTDFTKTKELNYINGELMASSTYTIGKDGLLKSVDDNKGTVYVWKITKLTDDSLVMRWTERDHENKYFRIKQTTSN